MAHVVDELFSPEELTPAAKDRVLRRLRELPVHGALKRRTLAAWSVRAGVAVTPDDFKRLAGGPRSSPRHGRVFRTRS